MKGVSRGPRGVRRASAAHSRTHSVWPSAGARFAARPCAVPIDALGGGACFPGLSSVRVRFILLTYLLYAGVRVVRSYAVTALAPFFVYREIYTNILIQTHGANVIHECHFT